MKTIRNFEYPTYVTLCLTSRCNAHCKHCSSAADNKIDSDLSTEKIMRVLDELYDCGIFTLSFSGGEPLLHPDFQLLAEYAVNKGFSIGLGTNGKIIDSKTISLIKSAGINHVQVSLDGSTGKTHDNFRGVNGMFDYAVNAIRQLVESEIETNVCMTPTRLNYLEFEDTIELCHDLGVRGFNLSQFVPIGRGSEEMDLEPFEWKEIMEIWFRKKKQYHNDMKFTTHEAQEILVNEELWDMKGFIGCQAGVGNCCIKADGTVTPCVMLDLPIGNLKTQTFKEIWLNSKIVDKLKDRESITGHCHDCKNLFKCGGCRGVAYSKTGNFQAADPRCWLQSC